MKRIFALSLLLFFISSSSFAITAKKIIQNQILKSMDLNSHKRSGGMDGGGSGSLMRPEAGAAWYYQDKKEIQGVTPITWMIAPNYKGMAGIYLFKKAMEQGDIGVVLGGTEIAQTLYPLFKYKHISNIHAREEFRQHSFIAPNAKGVLFGFGLKGYELAIQSFI